MGRRRAHSVQTILEHSDRTDGSSGSQSASLEEPAVVSNALQHFRRRPALGFSDSLMLEIARKAGHLPPGNL
jgi:hypothetical protein